MSNNCKPITYECSHCGHNVEPEIRMGALLCGHCRIVMYSAYSPEWNEAIEFRRANNPLVYGTDKTRLKNVKEN